MKTIKVDLQINSRSFERKVVDLLFYPPRPCSASLSHFYVFFLFFFCIILKALAIIYSIEDPQSRVGAALELLRRVSVPFSEVGGRSHIVVNIHYTILFSLFFLLPPPPPSPYSSSFLFCLSIFFILTHVARFNNL